MESSGDTGACRQSARNYLCAELFVEMSLAPLTEHYSWDLIKIVADFSLKI